MIGRAKVGLVALAVAAALVGQSGEAKAQSGDWLWGGSFISGGSGREDVRLNSTHPRGTIIVSFGDRRLYLITGPGSAISYPIAIPRDQSRWQGVTNVSMKKVNPPWVPTATMRAENPRLPNFVPGGHPLNPLGVRALYLGASAYRIHGTDAPWTIGQNVSKGCVRMYNQDVIDLYNRVPVGTRVVVTWQRFQTGAAMASFAPSGDDEARPTRRYSRSTLPTRRATRTRAASAAATE